MASDMVKKLRRKINPTPSGSPFRATEKVTRTYELLEHILRFLDPHSLRWAQLVNQNWHNIIHNSSTMKARLTWTDKPRTIRTFLIGAQGVGMRSLVSRLNYAHEYILDNLLPPGVSWLPSFRRAISVDDELWVIHGINDGYIGAGQQTAFLGHGIANCETFMLLYASDSRESFDDIKAWMARMESANEPLSMLVTTQRARQRRQRRGHPAPCLSGAVISTKNDLDAPLKTVESSEGAEFARKLGCAFVETSAATGDGVETAFAGMCRAYKQARLEQLMRKSKRSSLLGVASPSSMAEDRKERWWRWYRSKQQRA